MDDFETKKKPQQTRSRQTVDVILQSVISLVEAGRTENLTTTKIAEHAGVSIGSVYQYFPSKEAIYSSLVEWYLSKERALIVSALELHGGKSIEEAVEEVLRAIVKIRRKNLLLEQTILKYFLRTGSLEFLKAFDLKMVSEIDEALRRAASRSSLSMHSGTAFIIYHLIRSMFVAVTLESPALYESSEVIVRDLKRAILAILSNR